MTANSGEIIDGDDPLLHKLIGYSDFYVPVCAASCDFKNGNRSYFLGKITLKLSQFMGRASPMTCLPTCDRFYVYVNKDSTDLLVYYELATTSTQSQVTYYKATSSNCDADLWGAVKHKAFRLLMKEYDCATCCMKISVCI